MPLSFYKLDAKFSGHIFKAKDGTMVPENEYVVFLAKDSAFLPTLKFYLEECKRQGADEDQLKAVVGLIERVVEWRSEFAYRCKVPDASDERMLDVKSLKDPYANRQRPDEDHNQAD